MVDAEGLHFSALIKPFHFRSDIATHAHHFTCSHGELPAMYIVWSPDPSEKLRTACARGKEGSGSEL